MALAVSLGFFLQVIGLDMPLRKHPAFRRLSLSEAQRGGGKCPGPHLSLQPVRSGNMEGWAAGSQVV